MIICCFQYHWPIAEDQAQDSTKGKALIMLTRTQVLELGPRDGSLLWSGLVWSVLVCSGLVWFGLVWSALTMN